MNLNWATASGIGLGGISATAFLWNAYSQFAYRRWVVGPEPNAVRLGRDQRGSMVWMKQQFRTMHTQVIGTTSAGKTESVIMPWVIRDIESGAGTLIIDGKSDRSFLEKLYAYVVKQGRERDFRLFSLSAIDPSSTFNPLMGASPQEVAERVFSSFQFDNEYFKNVQYKVFLMVLKAFEEAGRVPTFQKVHDTISDQGEIERVAERTSTLGVRKYLSALAKMPAGSYRELVSGLDATLSHFTLSDASPLFDDERPMIDIDQALREGQIVYFQLPSMYYPFLAQATGKLVLQCLQSAIAKRHLRLNHRDRMGFFSVILDDFQDYIYEGFGSLLNKSRSANIGVVFSHQALGDLEKVSPAFKNVVLTNTNIKCVMRNNDPETCEHFAKSFGTTKTEKVTERQKRGAIFRSRSGEGSVREVDEYLFHPNELKKLGLGEGVVAIPHPKGVEVRKIKFERRPDLEDVALPSIPKVQKVVWELPPQPKVDAIITKSKEGK